ncbi:hypothetical protein ACJX0J_020629, partial [Zea mays]
NKEKATQSQRQFSPQTSSLEATKSTYHGNLKIILRKDKKIGSPITEFRNGTYFVFYHFINNNIPLPNNVLVFFVNSDYRFKIKNKNKFILLYRWTNFTCFISGSLKSHRHNHFYIP